MMAPQDVLGWSYGAGPCDPTSTKESCRSRVIRRPNDNTRRPVRSRQSRIAGFSDTPSSPLVDFSDRRRHQLPRINATRKTTPVSSPPTATTPPPSPAPTSTLPSPHAARRRTPASPQTATTRAAISRANAAVAISPSHCRARRSGLRRRRCRTPGARVFVGPFAGSSSRRLEEDLLSHHRRLLHNHAVKKADLGRTLETVYPVFNRSNGIWS